MKRLSKPEHRAANAQRNAAKKMARRIARALFTNGLGERAERLVLTAAHGRDLGGWCEEAVRDLIENLLEGTKR